MGDLIGSSVSGKLEYIDRAYFKRVIDSNLDINQKCEIVANLCRINALYMIAKAGSGHIGSSFSSMDIMTYLLLSNLNELDDYNIDSSFIFFSSKGHDAPALYSLYIGLGIIDFKKIHSLRRKDGLPGHPDIHTNGIFVNTGSLGMGVSKAKGLIKANRINGIQQKVFVLTGDGELQEGQFWESLISAANEKMHELVVVIDHNKLQSDTYVNQVSDLGSLKEKLKSFGFNCFRCDGNNFKELENVFNLADQVPLPTIIIADTIKGKGVSFMEHTSFDSDHELYKFHSGAPDSDSYKNALQELKDRSLLLSKNYNVSKPKFLKVDLPTKPAEDKATSLISSYSKILVSMANKYPIVALDADLVKDTGCLEFSEKFPHKFVECGIAEQDMVSQAGCIAAKGLIPIVHSFACFLSARPNEQIYNNCTEKRKVIYVGSLAGILPGGPGHSHQAVRDIAALSGIPYLNIIEPCCEEELIYALEWAINDSPFSTYIRLVSIPYVQMFNLPHQRFVQGRGQIIKNGENTLVITYGPIFTNLAYEIACEKEFDSKLQVVNMPWLNYLDKEWLNNLLRSFKNLVVIDNHYLDGGLGKLLQGFIGSQNLNIKSKVLAVTEIPICGNTEEVLNHHFLSKDSIREAIRGLN